jgi:hypothetical protein
MFIFFANGILAAKVTVNPFTRLRIKESWRRYAENVVNKIFSQFRCEKVSHEGSKAQSWKNA